MRKTQDKLAEYVKRHRANTIVIGNGTGSSETEEVVADLIAKTDTPLRYTIVNEAGASVYSASQLASEEYPEDVYKRQVLNIRSITKMLLAQLCRISDQYSAIQPRICLLYTSRCV